MTVNTPYLSRVLLTGEMRQESIEAVEKERKNNGEEKMTQVIAR